MQFLGAAQTRERLPFAPLIDALRTMFEQGCELPPRQLLELAAPDAEPVTSLVMPAWQKGGCYGVKVINIAPGNAARDLPGLHSTHVLYDATTGVPLAWLDGAEMTARRTAATSALAATWLARSDARHLAIVGAGRIARLLGEAHRVHRPIERATVIRDDGHLDLIGSFAPAMREADDVCFAAAAVFVDSDDAPGKSGDLIGPIGRGVLASGAIGTLAELARGRRPGRTSTAQRTVFKSVGSALEDLAAAILVHRAAPGAR